MKRRPQWDNSIEDPGKYRLSYAEQLSKKASYVSKNKEAAREQLRKKLDLLGKGIIPDEVKKVITPSQKQAQVPTKPSLSTVKSPTSASDKPKSFNEGRSYAKVHTCTPSQASAIRTTNTNGIVSQIDTLSKLELAMKELEDAMTKAMGAPAEAKSEISFNLSSDEEDGQFNAKNYQATDNLSEFKTQNFRQTERINENEEFGNIRQRQIDYIGHDFERSNAISPRIDIFKHKDTFTSDRPQFCSVERHQEFQTPASEPGTHRENPYTTFEKYTNTNLISDRIEYDIPENNDDEGNYLAELLAKTRKDLDAMNVPEVTFEEEPGEPFQNPYEEELMPRQFKLQPIQQTSTPRSFARSIALTDNLKQVQIQTRKFII